MLPTGGQSIVKSYHGPFDPTAFSRAQGPREGVCTIALLSYVQWVSSPCCSLRCGRAGVAGADGGACEPVVLR